MKLIRLRCPNCGAYFEDVNVTENQRVYKCTRLGCGASFILDQGIRFADIKAAEAEKIQNYREEMSQALSPFNRHLANRYAENILAILPDDYRAKAVLAIAQSGDQNNRPLYYFLQEEPDCTAEEFEEVFPCLLEHCDYRGLKLLRDSVSSIEPEDRQQAFLQKIDRQIEYLRRRDEDFADIPRDIFICHSSDDLGIVMKVVNALEADGNTCWYSERNMPPDSLYYWEKIKKAIRRCKIFLVCCSGSAMMSSPVKKELEIAEETKIKRVELKLDDTPHTSLFRHFFDGISWVKMDDDFDGSIAQLKEFIFQLLYTSRAKEERTAPDDPDDGEMLAEQQRRREAYEALLREQEEIEQQRKAEEERRKLEEQERQRLAEEKWLQEEEARLKAEAERREQEQRKAREKHRRLEEQERQRLAEEKRLLEEEVRRLQEQIRASESEQQKTAEERRKLEEQECRHPAEEEQYQIEAEHLLPEYRQIKIGDIITLGKYRQDSDPNSGPEAIEWQVLATGERRALLISKYALDTKPYNDQHASVTWEICTLRQWLNGTFYDTAFSAAEKSRIRTVTMKNPDNPRFKTKGDTDTTDRIFLLSIDEANAYFPSDNERQCEATAFAKANGAWVNSNNGNSWWWLRSPGGIFGNAANVYDNGAVNNNGSNVNSGSDVVRPAFWLDLSETDKSIQIPSAAGSSVSEAINVSPYLNLSPLTIPSIGDIFTFGRYTQDNDPGSGPEPVEWQVLAKEDRRALLISRYALDTKPYNEKGANVTWETCTLRKWLNGTFYDTAFSASEKNRIRTVTLKNPDNPRFKTKGGTNTTDRIFLLSIDEANAYFSSDKERRCEATPWAKANNALVDSKNGNSWWWLRSSGGSSRYASGVYSDGSIDLYGNSVTNDNSAVRPALWLDL